MLVILRRFVQAACSRTRYGGYVAGMAAIYLLSAAAAAAQPRAADTTWTIRSGIHAGVTVPVIRAVPGFLRSALIGEAQRVVSWNPSRFPIAVAIRHGRGSDITSEDSVAFWAILRTMESDIGMHLFRPATLVAQDDPTDVIIVSTRYMAVDAGFTLITWTSAGGVYDARVFVRDRTVLRNPRVVTHELMHALGFGHTWRFTSVLNPAPQGQVRLTPDDVAHAQFAIASRAAAQRAELSQRLALAIEREPEQAVSFPQECRFTTPAAFGSGETSNDGQVSPRQALSERRHNPIPTYCAIWF